ncbi:UPF0577 protein [Schistosoma japonicum]|nr:UPF0577 protein [Schistosoma japonicum]
MLLRLIIITSLISCVYSEACQENDLVVKSTDCDANGNRWLFKIPKDDRKCDLNDLSLPKRVDNCEMTCPSGMHLNLLSQNCEICPPGTYSTGDMLEVTKWNTMPDFLTSDVTHGGAFNEKCNLTGWSAQGKYLIGKTTDSCTVILSMNIFNQKSGTITFTYQIEEYGAMAFFIIRNERCTQLPGGSYILGLTGSYAYETVTFSVPVGHNILQWYLFVENVYVQKLYGLKDPEIHIKEIRLTGTPPVTTCTPCAAGSFGANNKADHCELCPRDTYSIEGATSCQSCPKDQYSGNGSSSCSPRPPCKKEDYTSYWTSCDQHQMTQRKWRWIEPKICNEDTGVSLPQPENPIECHKCPAGTFPLDGNTCELCSSGKNKNDVNLETCITCPSNEIPMYGLRFDNWYRMPSLLTLNCFNFFGVKCQTWERDLTSLRGGVGMHSDEVATLVLPINDGFITASSFDSTNKYSFYFQPPMSNTYVRIDFQLDCIERCQFSMKLVYIAGNEKTVAIWGGSSKRINHTYHVQDASAITFKWTFEKPGSRIHVQDHVKIYQIEVTNVKNDNAIGCQTCIRGVENGKCKTCPSGLYYSVQYDEINKTNIINCAKCPNNSIVVADASSLHTVNEACHTCEPGTIAVNHSICVTDTQPITASGFQYNLTEVIDRVHTVSSPKMFTPSGTGYYHEFLISLAYGKTVQCVENSTSYDHHTVNASICRHTKFESSSHEHRKTYSKPTRLADRLIRMVPSNVTAEFWQEINKNLTKAGWEEDKYGNDLHYIFTSDDHSYNCPRGHTTVLTLRCVFTENIEKFIYQVKDFSEYITGKIELPPSCPDGTCDGCTYHFLWTTMYACRMCQEHDYERILGECSYGHRKVHLRASWDCRIEHGKNLTITEGCPLLSKSQTAAVLLTTFILFILGLIIFMCHRRNKKLEYKYMKLVQSTSGKNQVTSCALESEGETDKGGSVYYTTMNNNNADNINNVDNYNRTRIKSPPSYADSTGIVLEPNEFLKNDHFTQMGFKGLPKVNLPPIIYKNKSDTDRDILTEEDQVL